MKVVFIGQKGIGDVSGGVEKHVEALAVRLVKKDCQPVIYARNTVLEDKRGMYKGIQIIHLPTIATKSLDTIVHTFLVVLHVFFHQRDVDVIHFHSIGPSSLVLLMRILKPKTLVIATMHAKCYDHSKWGIMAKIYLRLSEWICCTFAQKIIVISKDLQIYVQKRYNKKSIYMPNGSDVNDSVFQKDDTKWNIDEGEYFLFVGRLIPGKKVDLLIDAFKRLKTDKKLVIVGDSAHTDKYVASLHKKSRDNNDIILTGFQKSDTIKELLKGALAFVFPSESEGMSLVLLEAMSAHTPIIASDIAGNRAVLKSDECTFFEVNNINALQEALQNVLNHPNSLNEKAKKAHKKFIQKYTWDYIADSTYEVYKECNNSKTKHDCIDKKNIIS